jgi:hypothetical protein
MFQESVSLFMFMLQVREKEEAAEELEWILDCNKQMYLIVRAMLHSIDVHRCIAYISLYVDV